MVQQSIHTIWTNAPQSSKYKCSMAAKCSLIWMCFINDNIPEYIQQKHVMECTRNEIFNKNA
jgi:hypothetical protein